MDGRTLLLNATFEPLCAVGIKRAVILVLKDKAEVLEDGQGKLHSEKLTLSIPSVIRLVYYVKVPYYGKTSLSRKAVFARDGFRCQYCGTRAETVDHIVPRSRGGEHNWQNVVAACRKCNGLKRDKFPREVGLELRKKPAVPRGPVTVGYNLGSILPQWEPYLEYCWEPSEQFQPA